MAESTSGVKKGHKRHSHNLSQSMTALRKMTSDAAGHALDAKPARGSNESKHYLSLRSSADDGYPFDLDSFHPAFRPKATAADELSPQPPGLQAHDANTDNKHDDNGSNRTQTQPQPRVRWKRHSPRLEPQSLEDELRNVESECFEGSIGQPSLHSFSDSLSSSSTQRSIKDEGEKWWADDGVGISTNSNSNGNSSSNTERRSTDTIVAMSTPQALENKSGGKDGDGDITRRKSKRGVKGPREMPYSYTGTGLGSGSGSESIRGTSRPKGPREIPYRQDTSNGVRRRGGVDGGGNWQERESGGRIYDEKGFLRNSWLEEDGQLG